MADEPSESTSLGTPDGPRGLVRVDGPTIYVTVAIAGVHITIAKRNLEYFDAQDPYFFDSDYTIAGSTGFLLWEANWLLLRLLRGTPGPAAPAAAAPPIPPPAAAAPAAATAAAGPPQTLDLTAGASSSAAAVDAAAAAAAAGQPGGGPALQLGRLLAGRRVLDLGSGTGLAGLCAAAAGAHVLLTDLASVCSGALRQNVARNERRGAGTGIDADGSSGSAGAGGGGEPGGCGGSAEGGAAGAAAAPGGGGDGGGGSGRQWAGSVQVGCAGGSAAVMALDWTEPLGPQVAASGGNDPREADFILAVDTIWLLDIFHAFIDVVLAVLSHNNSSSTGSSSSSSSSNDTAAAAAAAAAAGAVALGAEGGIPPAGGPAPNGAGSAPAPPPGDGEPKACFLAFVERAAEDSKLFIKKERVVEELAGRGCRVEVLLAEAVDVDGVGRPGRVLRVTLAR
ncbi:hypothetical protein HXX76_000477 [Chlamydomonas incerta]|uniref:Methyltransferase n=1 Tax=Chlamydomonas incerta TaxID=51695 RepID=A0A835WEE6_CHLIN|nr:hypothetical protein HXX76_000477 [Chlamydomonas incerta]|eukprot:KAG2445873.1 hypothetical protein HXX76_000477 [Chlamydomonas incerta]